MSKFGKVLESLVLLGGESESNVDANDMNMGLLAIVLYGVLADKPVLEPKPKSICMAPSVAVCCGLSSKRLRTAGSNVVSELHSRGFAMFGDARGEEAEA
jgi:hypothetical protein